MSSESSARLWRVCKAAGRPWPIIVPEDDVLDYMVMEAMFLKIQSQDKEAAKEAERQAWKAKRKKELAQQTR